MTGSKTSFEVWYTVGHRMTRSARKAWALQAQHGGNVYRCVCVNGRTERELQTAPAAGKVSK